MQQGSYVSSQLVNCGGSSSGFSLSKGTDQTTRCENLYTRVAQSFSKSVKSHLGENSTWLRSSYLHEGQQGAWGLMRELDTFRDSVSSQHFEGLRPLGSQGFATAASENPKADPEKISVTFVNKDGEETEIQVPLGMSMLEAAHENDIELEGACEGSLACSTCHVIVMEEELYKKLPEPSDEENDMLDLAFGLTETSRLGCQVIAKPELNGMRLALPAATRNFAVDGHVPKPH